MKLYGEDDNFGDMADETGKILIEFDFNTAMPLLERKPAKTISIADSQFLPLMNRFKELMTKEDRKRDLLLLMRILKPATRMMAAGMGHRIAELFRKDSLVAWAAQEYHMYRFDFYLYDQPKFKIKQVIKGKELREMFYRE